MINGEALVQDPYDAVLSDLRAQRAKIDQTIEMIESLRGGLRPSAPATSTPASAPSQNAAPMAGDFLGMTIADAAVKLLTHKRKTLGNAEIAQEFKRGGLVLTSNEPTNVINSVLTRRFNQVGDIVRVERGVWGLQQWYPGRNFKKKGTPTADTEAIKKEDEPAAGTVASVPFMITNAMREKLRSFGASDDDIRNMTPEEARSYIETFEL